MLKDGFLSIAGLLSTMAVVSACGADEIGGSPEGPRGGPESSAFDGGVALNPEDDASVTFPPSSPPAGGDRPNAANTGPSGALDAYTGPSTITEDGATYENFSRVGQITIDADDVTLRNFTITSSSQWTILIEPGHSGILLEEGEITGSKTAAIRGVGFTGRRLHIHDTDSDAMKTVGSGGPTLIEHSFIERLGLHSDKPDGNQISNDTSNVTFRYNNFDIPTFNSAGWLGPPYASNAVFIHNEGTLSNIVVEHNWLNGGHFTIYCSVPGTHVRHNRFGRDNDYGVRSGTCDEWVGNVWDDTGEPIP